MDALLSEFRQGLFIKIQMNITTYTFNSSAGAVETGVIWLGGERNIRREETGAQDSLRFGGGCSLRTGLPLWSEHWQR